MTGFLSQQKKAPALISVVERENPRLRGVKRFATTSAIRTGGNLSEVGQKSGGGPCRAKYSRFLRDKSAFREEST